MSDAGLQGTPGNRKAAVHGLTFALMVLGLAVLQIASGFPLEWIGAATRDSSSSVWLRILLGLLPLAVMYYILWLVVGAFSRFISSYVAHGVARESSETHHE